ncbi:LysR family transcriptional regulator [Ketobacter sp. MCCC 1A13808]|uniref:LysR family transcriptional regulator n=1 Tax=Ketobacter sp. MCCC 1A13808 TaxID=2602738 RepID=UPI0012EC9E52|nr:LysR family transcriptional regulator [Ketobacter sp. MCCC 1A13808]MVF14879.1 LysR family transcriptional regulator [Ketobacter sp. MCCC 1A13808]
MDRSQLANFDLNLLLSLEALLTHKHVSRAADALSLTQSGMSRNLARLRDYFEDELLVRTGNRMMLTPRAEQLEGVVRSQLDALQKTLSSRQFDPTTAHFQFTIAAADFLMQLYIPDFLPLLLKHAPNIRLRLVGWSEHTFAKLENGELDFMFGGLMDAPAGVYRKTLGAAEHGCVSRKQHPVFKDGFDLERYLKVGHIALDLTGKGSNPVDDWLLSQGLQRNVVVRTPYCMSGVAMVSQTDLVMMGHRGLVERALKHYELDFHPLPFRVPMPPFGLLWHERTKNSAAHIWFREFVVSVLQDEFGIS